MRCLRPGLGRVPDAAHLAAWAAAGPAAFGEQRLGVSGDPSFRTEEQGRLEFKVRNYRFKTF